MKNSTLPRLFAPLHPFAHSARSALALVALLVAVFAAPSKSHAQTTLSKGDAVILSFSQSTFSFKWAPLVDLAPGTVVGITDYGVPGALFSPQTYPAAVTVDGAFTFTPTATVTKGTIFTCTISVGAISMKRDSDNSDFTPQTNLRSGSWSQVGGQLVTLAGDSFIIYQGDIANNPNFIFCASVTSTTISSVSNGFFTSSSANNGGNGTTLPSGLTIGTDAVGFAISGPQNYRGAYVGPATATDRNGWLARIVGTGVSPINSNGWAINNGTDPTVQFGNTLAFTSSSTTITSLNRASTNPSNASTVNYTLTFAAANTGVTASNFSLSGAASTGAVVGTPTTSNNITWTVPVTTGSTDGTLTLSVANATGWSPGVSNTLPFTTAGQDYTMDKTKPTVSISAPSSSIVGTGGTVTYLVTYTDTNFNSSTLGTGGITLNATGGAGGTVSVTGTGNTRTVTISSITGTGTLGITVAAATATDTAGNTNLVSSANSTVSVITANVIDFEAAPTGGWSLSSPMTLNTGATGYGSATLGASSPTSSGYIDANFNTASAVGTNVGGIKAPTGFTFRAVSFDIWPSANKGGDIIPYGTNGLGVGTNNTAETGHDFNVKGYLNGNVMVNITVKEKQRVPTQASCTGG